MYLNKVYEPIVRKTTKFETNKFIANEINAKHNYSVQTHKSHSKTSVDLFIFALISS